MKTMLKFSYLFLYSLAIAWLTNGCKPGGNEATPQTTCRIQQYKALSTSRFYNDNRQTTYSYDGQGNLLKIATVYDRKPLNGAEGAQTNTTTNTYTYNSEGYLTSSTENISETTVFAGKTTEQQFTTGSTYSYTNGHLMSTVDKRTGPYPSSNNSSTTTYEYDAAGDLIKMSTGNGIWFYRNNQLVDYGGTERPYTIQNGVITKSIFPGTTDQLVVTAMYDNQQRLIKSEEYLNGQLSSYYVQTWSEVKPLSAALPLFKGFPVTVPVSPFAGQVGVLATRKLYYWNSISKIIQQYSEDTYTVQANVQNLISTATILHKHPLAADQDYTTTEIYTYTGCQ